MTPCISPQTKKIPMADLENEIRLFKEICKKHGFTELTDAEVIYYSIQQWNINHMNLKNYLESSIKKKRVLTHD